MDEYNVETPMKVTLQEKDLLMMERGEPIESVYLRVFSDDDVRMSSACEIRHSLRGGGSLFHGKVVDSAEAPEMGATENITCATCTQSWPRCPGHFGHVELDCIFVRPAYAKKAAMIYSSICHACYRLKPVVPAKVSTMYDMNAVQYAYKESLEIPECPHCQTPSYVWDNKYNLSYNMSDNPTVKDREKLSAWELFSEMYVMTIPVSKEETPVREFIPTKYVKYLLNKISSEDRGLLNISNLEIEDLFFSVFPVMPNRVRPARDMGGKLTRHMFTRYYEELTKDQKNFRETMMNITDYREMHIMAKMALLHFKSMYKNGFPDESVENEYNRLQLEEENMMKMREQLNEGSRAYVSFIKARRTLYWRCMEMMTQNGKQAFKDNVFSGFKQILNKKEGDFIQLNSMLKGKYGIVRDNILGKRVDFCARTVASPAPMQSKMDEVWMPEKFKNSLLRKEVFSSENRNTLLEFEKKGMIVYVILMNSLHMTSSASFLYDEKDKKSNYDMFGTRKDYWRILRMVRQKHGNRANIVDFLLPGDVIDRQLMDGVDHVLINRQPSIWKYSLNAFRVRWWSNATIGVTDVSLKPFNGDFDGDEFNAWDIRDGTVEGEVVQVLAASKNVLGEARNATAFGLHYDSLTGLFLLTRIVRRTFPLPETENTRKILDFIRLIHGQYFQEVNESKNLDRIVLTEYDPESKQIVFSSEAIFPNYTPDFVFANGLRTPSEMEVFKSILKRNNIHEKSGRALISMLLPPTFFFKKGKGSDELVIERGVIVKGTITKGTVGAFERDTFFPTLTRLYGFEYVADLVDHLVWLAKAYLTNGHTLSFGLDDYGFLSNYRDVKTERNERARIHVEEYRQVYNSLIDLADDFFTQGQTDSIFQTLSEINFGVKRLSSGTEARRLIAQYLQEQDENKQLQLQQRILTTTATFEERIQNVHKETYQRVIELEMEKENAIRMNEGYKVALLEERISRMLDGIRTEETKIITGTIDPENAFIQSHGKGGEIFEVMGSVGQQFMSGGRHPISAVSGRVLPSHLPGDLDPSSRGMVRGNFTRGISPQDAYFISWAARIGPVITKTQTAVIGDLANRLTNAFGGIYVHEGACQDMTRSSSQIVQFSCNGDNFSSKYMMVKTGASSHILTNKPTNNRLYSNNTQNQTPIDTISLNMEINKRFPDDKYSGMTESELETIIRPYLNSFILNKFGEIPDRSNVYLVKGVSRIVVERIRHNILRNIIGRLGNLQFPESYQRLESIQYTLERVRSILTGFSSDGTKIIESTHVSNGDKIGALISGAVQQPTMQAAMDTFKKSGQSGNSVSVKDSFLRLTALTTDEKDYGFIQFQNPPRTFREAYRLRMKLKSITLNDVVDRSGVEIHVDSTDMRSGLPAFVSKLMAIRTSEEREAYIGNLDEDRVFWMSLKLDPVKLRAHNIRGLDITYIMIEPETKDKSTPRSLAILSSEQAGEMIILFNRSEKNAERQARGFFMTAVFAKLESIYLNDIIRGGVKHITDARPFAIRLLDLIDHIYKLDDTTYEIHYGSREVRRLGVKANELIPALKEIGYSESNIHYDASHNSLQIKNMAMDPVDPIQKLRSKLAEEEDKNDREWKSSLERGKPKEPEAGPLARLLIRFALITDGNNSDYVFRSPHVNYRTSVCGDINRIVDIFGLRAGRNFLAYELERLFEQAAPGSIDYRHVILMVDTMVSTGEFSKLTYQGVDKMTGPNPLNQMGVGYNPAGAIARAALTGTSAPASAGFAVSIMAGKSTIPRDRTEEALNFTAKQKDTINKYLGIFQKGSSIAPKNLSGLTPPAVDPLAKVLKEHTVNKPKEEAEKTKGKPKLLEIPREGLFMITADLSRYYNSENPFTLE